MFPRSVPIAPNASICVCICIFEGVRDRGANRKVASVNACISLGGGRDRGANRKVAVGNAAEQKLQNEHAVNSIET